MSAQQTTSRPTFNKALAAVLVTPAFAQPTPQTPEQRAALRDALENLWSTGTNRYRDVTLHLKPKLAVGAAWSLSPRWQADASVATIQGVALPEAGLSWQAATGPRVRLSYETRFGSAGLGVRAGPIYIEVRSDRLDLNDARSVGARAGLAVEF